MKKDDSHHLQNWANISKFPQKVDTNFHKWTWCAVLEGGRKGQFKEMSCFPFSLLSFSTLDDIFLFEPLCPWRASKSINLSQLSIYNRGPHFLAQWYPEACQWSLWSLVSHPVSRLERRNNKVDFEEYWFNTPSTEPGVQWTRGL